MMGIVTMEQYLCEDFGYSVCVAPADGQCAVNTSRPEGKITGIS